MTKMTTKSEVELHAISRQVEYVMLKYRLPWLAFGDLFEIATLTARWQANETLAKLVGVQETPKIPTADESRLN